MVSVAIDISQALTFTQSKAIKLDLINNHKANLKPIKQIQTP